MTKAEYLRLLQEKLESFNRELQSEIMEDYEQHFAEGLAEGKSEEEIIEELGNIEDMIRELPEEEIRQEIAVEEPEDFREDCEMDPEAERSGVFGGEYRGVVIDGLVADVTLESSEDGRIHVDYRNDGDRLRYCFFQYEQDGVFHAGVKKVRGYEEGDGNPEENGRSIKVVLFGKTLLSYRKFYSDGGDIKLSVRIPEGMPVVELKTASGDVRVSRVRVGKLTASAASGDMEIENMSAEQADIGTASGKMNIRRLRAERTEIKSASGDMEIRGLAAGQVNVKTTSGDITVFDGAAAELELQSGSGDVELESLQAQKVHLHSGSGDINGTAVSGKELYAVGGSGDISIFGNMEEYTIKTESGDVVLKAGRKTVCVRVETGSGDAEVDMKGAENVEVSASVGSGDGVIYGADGSRHQVSHGGCTVGSGDCKVSVNVGSGDLEVRC